jgi:group I intron endonuclease
MTIGIYSITHVQSGKRYIGKSINVEGRLIHHRSSLTSDKYRPKAVNRHLYSAVQKYGWSAFCVEILQSFESIDESTIAERELFWMDHFNTVDRKHGFNLRRDSSTSMIVHDETRERLSKVFKGDGNPNHGNYWSDEKKQRMSEIKKAQHAAGDIYTENWKKRQGIAISKMWKTNFIAKSSMALKLSKIKQRYRFMQCQPNGEIIRTWNTVKEIVAANPEYKWQNIYSVCNGYKPTYMGYVWKKESLCQE